MSGEPAPAALHHRRVASGSFPWLTIAGISPAIRHSSPVDAETDPVVYVPYGQKPPSGTWVLVRTPLPAGSVSGDIRRAVQGIDGDQPIYDIQSICDLLRERRWPQGRWRWAACCGPCSSA